MAYYVVYSYVATLINKKMNERAFKQVYKNIYIY